MKSIFMKRVLPILLSISMMFSLAGFALAADEPEDEIPGIKTGAVMADFFASADSFATDVLKNVFKSDKKMAVFMATRLFVGFIREVNNLITAQRFSDELVEQYTREILDDVSCDLILNDEGDTGVVDVKVPLDRDNNAYKLLNVKVLRNVCREFEKMQMDYIPEELEHPIVTSYEHFVGELFMHIVAYLALKHIGGENSPLASYYFKAKQADLSQNEERFIGLIDLASKIFA